jgi:hypothetical protein
MHAAPQPARAQTAATLATTRADRANECQAVRFEASRDLVSVSSPPAYAPIWPLARPRCHQVQALDQRRDVACACLRVVFEAQFCNVWLRRLLLAATIL